VSHTEDAKALVEQIRSAVQSARAMPMSSSVVVNRPDLLALVDKLVDALPDVDQGGGAEAEAVLAQARKERERLVSEVQVHAAAEHQAKELLDEARRDCDELRREADAYVDTTFAHLQVALTKTLEALNRGRERLSGRSDLDALSPGGAEGNDQALPPLPS
jgi:nucleotide-binding universal stress UspA family protein